MKLRGGQQMQFNQIKENMYNALSLTSFPTTLYRAIESIVHILNAIRKTGGKGWALTVVNDEGVPLLSSAEQLQFTNALQPYIGSILSLFDDEPPHIQQGTPQGKQQGGAEPTQSAPVQSSAPTQGSTKIKDKLASGWKSGVTDKVSAHMDGISASDFDPDTLFEKIMSTFQHINKTMNETAEQVHFEKEFDDNMDIPVGNTGIFVPPRLISFLVYIVLDITRIAVSISGHENGRKILSVLVALVELVRGNWKKAVLSFIGYFGMSPFYIGQMFKTYLTVIQMLSPTIQVKLPYFMFDSAKSILFGLIIAVVQIGAPKVVRDQIKKLSERLNLVQDEINGKLEALNPPLSERPEYLKLDFSNLNHLQSIMDDPVYICSKEHRDAINELLQQSETDVPTASVGGDPTSVTPTEQKPEEPVEQKPEEPVEQKPEEPATPTDPVKSTDPVAANPVEQKQADPVAAKPVDAVEPAKKPNSGKAMIQFILSLIRYPHTPGMTKLTCDTNTKMSYVDLLVKEGLKRDAATAPKEATAPKDATSTEATSTEATSTEATSTEATEATSTDTKPAKPKATTPTRGGSNRTRRNKHTTRFTLKSYLPLEHQQDRVQK